MILLIKFDYYNQSKIGCYGQGKLKEKLEKRKEKSVRKGGGKLLIKNPVSCVRDVMW